ncbi:MAG: hypothetical protein A3G03_01520 [Candidatus Taylorbacteria bacterium RIFCSPLOWO2_12_FULL_44_15c]|uniref:Peptidoglycan binding-like domain-containing protein n=1 Tax=Candidatus Taylorbacteria bacterium RIFCSPLOWO2_12_FULL_44_15c TaxID=1802333 RepID=A0A1G2P6X2_9BACT|nr:MAG: hypothetical protein A3G03_01520 [Candidatus Taylorbacteria bacterium RIFCSPLOWO2_12_FULL_44_15c]
MKLNKLITGLVAAVLLLSTSVVFAAYDDVSLSTGSEISVSGGTLTGAGGATLESLTVDTSTFTVVMPANSSFTFASADKKTITVTGSLGSVTVTSNCGSSSSTYTFTNPSSGSTLNLTIEVGSATCSGGLSVRNNSNSVTFGVGGGGGGGGGGGSTVVAQTTTPTTPIYASGLSSTQVNAIIALLQSFNADQSVIDKVKMSLSGAVKTTGSSVSGGTTGIGIAKGYVFAKSLKTGNTNTDVKMLQLILNSSSDTQISASGAGSPGNETNYYGSLTRKAVEKFQVKYGIAKSGEPGYGTVGPMTRAKLNELAK